MDKTVKIYWDNQDNKNNGWGWASKINGDHDSTGPLGHGYQSGSDDLELLQEMTDNQLVDILKKEYPSMLDFEVEVVR
jgi:hypothetical protein